MGAIVSRPSVVRTLPQQAPPPWLFILGASIAASALALKFLKRQRFELGSLDLVSMTPKAAKELHRSSSRGLRTQRSSLVPSVLKDLEEGGGAVVVDAATPTEEVDERAKALEKLGVPPFRHFLKQQRAGDLVRGVCKILQLNIGLYCNQACTHCHVESSPLRKEMAKDAVIERILHLIKTSPSVEVLDITGGAPELNNGFRRLVQGAAEIRDEGAGRNLRIIDRCNLTVLVEPGQEELAGFLAAHRVDIVASLPSYDASQTDRQRGRKVFERSIEAMRILNSHGYATNGANLRMDLIFNPPGPFLPPKQDALEAKYKQQLKAEHGVVFDNLITLANMPVKRFFDHLRKTDTLDGYMDLLVRNFNAETVPLLMCRETVNIKYDGQIYDCDFNQQLELGIGRNLTIFDIDCLDDERLRMAPIVTRAHCYGCTAAQGSG